MTVVFADGSMRAKAVPAFAAREASAAAWAEAARKGRLPRPASDMLATVAPATSVG